MRRFLVAIITLYQKTISPDHGLFRARHPYGYCRFHPTCSEYTKQAISQFGVARGTWLGILRIIRCHPWSAGGIDEIPQPHQTQKHSALKTIKLTPNQLSR